MDSSPPALVTPPTPFGVASIVLGWLLAPTLQLIFVGLGFRWLALLVSPLHAGCFLAILLVQMVWLHPAKEGLLPLWQERCAAMLRSGRGTGMAAKAGALQELLQEPFAQHLLASAPPPASAPYALSMLASLVGDVCQALHAATDNVAWAVLHALGASVSAGGFLYASWRDGSTSSHAVRGICWAGAFAPVVPALERLLTMEDEAAALGAADPTGGAGGGGGRGSSELLLRGMLACRLVVCGALAARCAEAAGSRLYHAYMQRGARPRPMDLRRLGLHLSGALLLLGGGLMPSWTPAAPAAAAARSLGLGLDRLGTGGFGVSGWLLQHPPPELAEQVARAEAEALEGVDAIKASHREARAARARAAQAAPAIAPLLLRCPHGRYGGVQGMDVVEAMLATDGDGDEAHEFWEASDGGCFQLLGAPPGGGLAAAPGAPPKKGRKKT